MKEVKEENRKRRIEKRKAELEKNMDAF